MNILHVLLEWWPGLLGVVLVLAAARILWALGIQEGRRRERWVARERHRTERAAGLRL